MRWSVETVSPPTKFPVTLDEAKLHLRLPLELPEGSVSIEDELIHRLIGAATQDAELYQGRAYITRTLRLNLDRFPAAGGPIYLPFPPVQQVLSVEYTDAAGQQHTLPATDYVADLAAAPARLVPAPGKGWPLTSLRPVAGVTVTYVAGYGEDPQDVPENIRSAILLLVGHLYEHREAVFSDRGTPQELPLGVTYLLAKDRVFVPEVA